MSTTLVVTTSWPTELDPIAGTFVRSDALARARRGERVIVVAPGGRGEPERGSGIEVIEVSGGDLFGTPGAMFRLRERPHRLLAALPWARAVSALLRRQHHDRLVLHWLVPTSWFAGFSRAEAIELRAHGGDVRVLEALPRSIARALLAASIRDPRVSLWAASTSLARRIETLCPRASPIVEPPPLALEDAALRARVMAAADRLRQRSDKPFAVVAARLVPEKRIDRAVRWAADRGLSLTLVGDGPARESLLAAARRRGVPLHAPGALAHEDALAWLAAADVVLAPLAPGEGAPTVIRETHALGREVVVFP